jgi:hypothetical protein
VRETSELATLDAKDDTGSSATIEDFIAAPIACLDAEISF